MVRLQTATVICYRVFDVADAIALERCRTLITQGGSETRRIALTRAGGEYIRLSNPPLSLDVGNRTLTTRHGPVEVRLTARIFDHGAISVLVRVPIEPGSTLETLLPFADELYDSDPVERLARDELGRLKALLAPAMEGPHDWAQSEQYTVIFATDLGPGVSAAQVLEDPALARLLLGEVKEPALSAQESREVLDHHFSYTDRDLAVMEWNAAFLYEPSGSEDLLDLIDIANAQLLELRYYDEVLDKELTRVYDVIGQRRAGSLLFSPYKQLARELMLNLIDLSEFIERIENSLKIVGDVYLARVYEATLSQFRVRQWSEQVSRKHRLLQQTYALLKGEVDTGRALTLETMVVVLILFEIVMALVKVTGH